MSGLINLQRQPELWARLFHSSWRQRMLFDPGTESYLGVLSQLGLVFMMFLIGIEFDFGHLTSCKGGLSISWAGIVLPIMLGSALGSWMHWQMDLRVDKREFVLFVATALSITAMPVLGRILIEFNPPSCGRRNAGEVLL